MNEVDYFKLFTAFIQTMQIKALIESEESKFIDKDLLRVILMMDDGEEENNETAESAS